MHNWLPYQDIEGLSYCSCCGYWRYEIDRWGTDKRVTCGRIGYSRNQYTLEKPDRASITNYNAFAELKKKTLGYFYSCKLDVLIEGDIMHFRMECDHRACPARESAIF